VLVGPAILPDYRIHIGKRATLLRAASSRVYGIVMRLPDHEADALYSGRSVRDYTPERVRVSLWGAKGTIEADCYNLPPESGLAGANPAYANELSRLAERLGFDPVYVAEINAFAEGDPK